MKHNGYRVFGVGVAMAAIALAVFVPGAIAQTPSPTSAITNVRVFNDCPTTTLTETNSYPSMIGFHDVGLACSGFANLHNWRLSEDGATAVSFPNASAFSLTADVQITGSSDGEAGLSVAPWWSPDVDGRFNVRSTDGEIACFGGRLPFYSFTGSQGLTYTKGDVITLQVIYLANDLSMANPATIEYKIVYNGMSYTSGPLAFDEGNPAEDPPYGLWGMLNNAQAGGYVQEFMVPGDFTADLNVTWSNIVYENLNSVAIEPTTFGSIKSRY